MQIFILEIYLREKQVFVFSQHGVVTITNGRHLIRHILDATFKVLARDGKMFVYKINLLS